MANRGDRQGSGTREMVISAIVFIKLCPYGGYNKISHELGPNPCAARTVYIWFQSNTEPN